MLSETVMALHQPSTDLASQPTTEIVISVRNLGKMYRIYQHPQDRLKQMLFWRFGRSYGHEFWALRNVSFDIRKGETIGVIGRNGSGKSTLLQMIAGTLAPSEGEVQVLGRVAALLELGSGFNPEFTGRENVFLNGAILGVSHQEMAERFADIANFADIGEFIDQPVKLYSSGMVVRLAFAVAACVEPDILIVDEALAVGDVMFQARCLERIRQLQANGTTTLFVTHDTGTFQNLCDYGYMLDHGKIFSQGTPSHVAQQYYELMRESEHARQRIAVGTDPGMVQTELQQREDQIREKSEEREYRFGSNAAQIVRYQVINVSGQETAVVACGEPFRVIVHIEFQAPVYNLSLGVMLRNAQGQNLFGMHSYVENRVQFGYHNAGETLAILAEHPMLLNPGDYLLHLSIADCRSDYDFVSLDSRSNLTKITVIGKPLGYGLIHTHPHFTVLSGGDSQQQLVTQTWSSMQWLDWTDWLLERCHRLVPDAVRILEIGGQGRELNSFLQEAPRQFTTLNFPTDDICQKTRFQDESFDLIVSKMTYEHLYDPFAAADEMTRLLAQGGVLIAMTVWSWRYHTAPGFDDFWRFSTAGMRQLFPHLQVIEVGYDLSDRRKDCRLDNVPVDELGGWREQWYVYIVARKHTSTPITHPIRRTNQALLNCNLEQIKAIYSQVLDDPHLTPILTKILQYDQAPIADGTGLEQEERSWPGEPRFVEIGYHRMMLGRYAFAASQFCRNADVLETCCGLGWGTYLVAHYARHVTAFDIDSVEVQRCAERWPANNITWQAGNACDLKFLGNAQYDVALGMEAIEHLSYDDGSRYLREIAAHLRPGGVFIATSAFPETIEAAEQMRKTNPFHLHIFTQSEILELLDHSFSRAVVIGGWMVIAIK